MRVRRAARPEARDDGTRAERADREAGVEQPRGVRLTGVDDEQRARHDRSRVARGGRAQEPGPHVGPRDAAGADAREHRGGDRAGRGRRRADRNGRCECRLAQHRRRDVPPGALGVVPALAVGEVGRCEPRALENPQLALAGRPVAVAEADLLAA